MFSRHVVGALVAIVAASVTSTAANAQAAPGHFEWRSTLQPGPRAPLTAPRRVWVESANAPSTVSQPGARPLDSASPCPPPPRS